MHHSTDNNRGGRAARAASGYLLLESVLALAISALVLSGVFALSSGALKLSESIANEGRTQVSQETFLTFLERNLEGLPGNAVVDLQSKDQGSHYVSELTFQNVPVTFSWAGQSLSPEAVQLATVLRVDGTLDIVLRYYDEPILDETAESEMLQVDPVSELILLRDVWRFEWEVLDARTMEWDYVWDIRARRPLQLRLNAVFHPEGAEVVHYFWIPPKIDPKTVINSANRLQGRGQRPGGQQPEAGDETGEGQNPRGGGDNPRGGGDVRRIPLPPRVNPPTGGGG